MLSVEGRGEGGEDKTATESNASWRVQGVASRLPLVMLCVACDTLFSLVRTEIPYIQDSIAPPTHIK